jgi:hypothetical protein
MKRKTYFRAIELLIFVPFFWFFFLFLVGKVLRYVSW